MRMSRRMGLFSSKGTKALVDFFSDMTLVAAGGNYNHWGAITIDSGYPFNVTTYPLLYCFGVMGPKLQIGKIKNKSYTVLKHIDGANLLSLHKESNTTCYMESTEEYYGGDIAVVTFSNYSEAEIDAMFDAITIEKVGSEYGHASGAISASLTSGRLYLAATNGIDWRHACYISISDGATPTTPIFSTKGGGTNIAYLKASGNEYYVSYDGESDSCYVGGLYSIKM